MLLSIRRQISCCTTIRTTRWPTRRRRRRSNNNNFSFSSTSLIFVSHRTRSTTIKPPFFSTTSNNSTSNNNSNTIGDKESSSSFTTTTTTTTTKRVTLSLYDSLSQETRQLLLQNNDDVPSSHDDNDNNNSNDTTTTTTRIRKNNNKKKKGLAWYTCGPTTYAPAHMGHARTYVWVDIIRRVLESEYYNHLSLNSNYDGNDDESSDNDNDIVTEYYSPLFVMNITDVDDKILAAAAAAPDSNKNKNKNSRIFNDDDNDDTHHDSHNSLLDPAIQLSRHYEIEFWKDLDRLNCLRPHVVTRVTEYVESDIIPYVERLLDLGMAYPIEDDGIYFDVRAYNHKLGHLTKYGKLAPPSASQDIEINTSRSSSSSRNNDEQQQQQPKSRKRDPRDFVLWKNRKPNEQLYWSSSRLGDGRPGWHIECSAMIEAVQSKFNDTHQFQVHAGGIDLKFPHHSNEIAQSEAYHQNGQWIQHWIHTGHLHIDGQKMSKSLKNFITIQEFLDEFGGGGNSDSKSNNSNLVSPADDFRLWCLGLSGKYRGPATFSKTRILEARSIREKIVRFLLDCDDCILQQQQNPNANASKKWSDQDHELFIASEQTKQVCIEALRNDLDGAKFVNELVALCEFGTRYFEMNRDRPEEVLHAVANNIRSLLSLVGFSNRTIQSKMNQLAGEDETQQKHLQHSISNVVGGERAIIDSFVEFRSLVRQSALNDIMMSKKNKQNNKNLSDIDIDDEQTKHALNKKLLQLCDEYRDSTLPSIGVEIQDGIEASSSNSWRYCLPKQPSTRSQSSLPTEDSQNESSSSSPTGKGDTSTNKEKDPNSADAAVVDLLSIPIQDYFRVGQYAGMFSEYSKDGIPLRNADGTEVSKRLRKKLLKKRKDHETRLDKHTNHISSTK